MKGEKGFSIMCAIIISVVEEPITTHMYATRVTGKTPDKNKNLSAQCCKGYAGWFNRHG